MSIRSIVFWYNAPTIHQYGLIRALASQESPRVTIAAFNELLPDRREMGWDEPDFGAATRIIVRNDAERRDLVSANAEPDCLHVFSGIHGFRPVYRSLRTVLTTRAKIGVMAIGPDSRGVKGLLRFVKHRVYAARVRDRVDLVLASGRIGVAWYRRMGFPETRVFEFGNFSDATNAPGVAPDADRPPRLAYVGSLSERKGVAVLLAALAELSDIPWTLEIIGDGPVKSPLLALASRLGVERRIEWSGFRAHGAVSEALGRADVAVLPSFHDGWGSVVNEALLAGTPVVCTDRCGAAVVVSASGHGRVVRAGDHTGLRDALRIELGRGRRSPAERTEIRRWATRLTPESGAAYFGSILRHVFDHAPRPLPPWTSID